MALETVYKGEVAITAEVVYCGRGESINAACKRLGGRCAERRETVDPAKVIAIVRERGVPGDYFALSK